MVLSSAFLWLIASLHLFTVTVPCIQSRHGRRDSRAGQIFMYILINDLSQPKKVRTVEMYEGINLHQGPLLKKHPLKLIKDNFGYYLGVISIVLAIISLLNNNIVLTKLIAKMWEWSNIAKKTLWRSNTLKQSGDHTDFKQIPKIAEFTWRTKANRRFTVVSRLPASALTYSTTCWHVYCSCMWQFSCPMRDYLWFYFQIKYFR